MRVVVPSEKAQQSPARGAMGVPDSSGASRRARLAARCAFALLLLAYATYAGVFIANTSICEGGKRYFTLFDDAMVSMRYARNLARGNGLVWNAGGERVEGFTNPLWTFYMALAHLAVPSPYRVSLVIQITGALLLLVNLVFVRRLALMVTGGRETAAFCAAFLTAFYLPMNNWTLQGMEVGLLALLTTAASVLTLRWIEGGGSPLGLYLLLGVATFVRPDAISLFLGVLLFVAWCGGGQERRRAAIGFFVLVGLVALQTLGRIAYFGDPLPNTYYLKMSGYPALSRMARGARVAWRFLLGVAPLALVVPQLVAWSKRRRAALLLPWLFAVQLAYSVYVGGDAWEWWGGANRYVSPAMPLMLVAFAASIDAIFRLVARRPWAQAWTAPGAFLVSALSLVVINQVNRNARPIWLLREPPLHVVQNAKDLRRTLVLSEVTLPTARVAVLSAGIVPYFADRWMIDVLGKNDRRIAREPMRDLEFYPGHLKWNYAHSIGALQPDVIVDLWLAKDEAYPFLKHDYVQRRVGEFVFLFRIGSPRVLWDRVERYGARPLARAKSSFFRHALAFWDSVDHRS